MQRKTIIHASFTRYRLSSIIFPIRTGRYFDFTPFFNIIDKFVDFFTAISTVHFNMCPLFIANFKSSSPSLLLMFLNIECWCIVIYNFIISFTGFPPNMTIKPNEQKWNGYFFHLLFSSPVNENQQKDNKFSVKQKKAKELAAWSFIDVDYIKCDKSCRK